MRIGQLNGEEKNKEIVFRVFRVYRVNEKYPKYPIYPKYPRYIFAEIAVCAHENVRIEGSGTSRTSDSRSKLVEDSHHAYRIKGWC